MGAEAHSSSARSRPVYSR